MSFVISTARILPRQSRLSSQPSRLHTLATPMDVTNNEWTLQQPSAVMAASTATLFVGQRSAVVQFFKRLMDVLGAAVLIVLLVPLFIFATALAYLEDGAPIIHRRRVVGRNGEFDAFKFRTMRLDADLILAGNPTLLAEYQRNFKLLNDPRVTRDGALLRK